MNNKKIALTILCIVSQSALKANFWDWYSDPATEREFTAAENLAEQELEFLFQPHRQDPSMRDRLLKLKEVQKENIRKNLESQYLSKQQAKEEAKLKAQESCKNFLTHEAVKKAEEYLKKSGFGTNHPLMHPLVNEIHRKIRQEAQQKINKNERLTELLKNLSDKVERLVDAELQKLPEYQQESYYSENDIKEIYPSGKVDVIRQRIEQGKNWREAECVICMESFNKTGKRINLECGHASMCLKCFKEYHIKNGKNSCPLCRQKIASSDFSSNYLNTF